MMLLRERRKLLRKRRRSWGMHIPYWMLRRRIWIRRILRLRMRNPTRSSTGYTAGQLGRMEIIFWAMTAARDDEGWRRDGIRKLYTSRPYEISRVMTTIT